MSGEYTIAFTNLTGCAAGTSDIFWAVTVTASSDSEALESALQLAKEVNREAGLPPHGLRVGDAYLEQLAIVWERP
jgi:hypothetical protein